MKTGKQKFLSFLAEFICVVVVTEADFKNGRFQKSEIVTGHSKKKCIVI